MLPVRPYSRAAFFTGRQLIYAADRFQLRLDIRTAAFTQCKAHQIFPCRYAGYPEQDLCQTVHGKPCCCDQQNLLHGRLPFFCSIVSHIIPIFSNFSARSEVMMQLLFCLTSSGHFLSSQSSAPFITICHTADTRSIQIAVRVSSIAIIFDIIVRILLLFYHGCRGKSI